MRGWRWHGLVEVGFANFGKQEHARCRRQAQGFGPVVRTAVGSDRRVIVDVADVVLRGGVPYYRFGQYGYDDRLIVGGERRGRPMYYRHLPRREYGRFYEGGRAREVKCNRNGRCAVVHYDPRYDRRYDNRHYRNDDRRW